MKNFFLFYFPFSLLLCFGCQNESNEFTSDCGNMSSNAVVDVNLFEFGLDMVKGIDQQTDATTMDTLFNKLFVANDNLELFKTKLTENFQKYTQHGYIDYVNYLASQNQLSDNLKLF